jgi:hypothetical protein
MYVCLWYPICICCYEYSIRFLELFRIVVVSFHYITTVLMFYH